MTMRSTLMPVLACISGVLPGCGMVVSSYYGLGEEGKHRERIFEGSWYVPDTDGDVLLSYDMHDNLVISHQDDAGVGDSESGEYRMNIVRVGDRFLFDGLQTEGVASVPGVPMHMIGRFEPYGDCWCFEILGGKEAYMALIKAGLPMLDRDDRLGYLRREMDGSRDEDPDDEASIMRPLADIMRDSFDNVLLVASSQELRDFLARDDLPREVFGPLMLCPGEQPRTPDAEFDHEAFALRHPEASAILAKAQE